MSLFALMSRQLQLSELICYYTANYVSQFTVETYFFPDIVVYSNNHGQSALLNSFFPVFVIVYSFMLFFSLRSLVLSCL